MMPVNTKLVDGLNDTYYKISNCIEYQYEKNMNIIYYILATKLDTE